MSSQTVSTKLQKIAELASYQPKLALTTLAHHIDEDWLDEAFRRTRKAAAAGVDGKTAVTYARKLDENLSNLLQRLKAGQYRAPAVRRTYIDKDGGKQRRPLGIPTVEDKVLQRAVAMILEAVYEQDFYDCSYGFRPNRGAHQALTSLRDQLHELKGGYVIQLDIRSFFDEMDHSQLREMLSSRVRDGVIMRLIGKWLKAGVLEGTQLTRPTRGTPQGGVVSPVLANVYLHHVLDEWFHQDVLPRLKGRAFMVRYADDAVLAFANREDANRVLKVLPKRFERFSLRLHPEKTMLINFCRPSYDEPRNVDKSGTIKFLGFDHYWGKSRRGYWVIKRKTEKKRLRSSVLKITAYCKYNRHKPVEVQQHELSLKMRGHYAYYGLTGNYRALMMYYHQCLRAWKKWLSRRNSRGMRWERFELLQRRYPLPVPRIVHSIYRT